MPAARFVALAIAVLLAVAPAAPAQDDPPPPDPPPAPTVTITGGPANGSATRSATASFSFTKTPPEATTTCSVDGAAPAPCASSHATGTLGNGSHTFAVTATNETGTATASRTWTIDTAAPAAPVITAPVHNSHTKEKKLVFTGEANVTFECRLDIGTFQPCTSPWDLTDAFEGAHWLTVRAKDAVGVGPEAPAVFTEFDTVKPTVKFFPPADLERSAAPAIGLGSSENNVTFACKVDGTDAPCATMWDAITLTPGAHALSVTATDRAGNTGDPNVLSWTYTPQSQPPGNPPGDPPAGPPQTPPVSVVVNGPPGTTATVVTGGGATTANNNGNRQPTSSTPRAPATLMTPFPIVRLAGELLGRTARITLLTVTAPRSASVDVRCRGKGCPRSTSRVRATKQQTVKVGWLAGARLRAGTTVEIRVTQAGRIGKYTRFRIRAGAAPQRRDACLKPGSAKPVSCAG